MDPSYTRTEFCEFRRYARRHACRIVSGLIGRLRPGVSLTDARSEMKLLLKRLRSFYGTRTRLRFGTQISVQSLSRRIMGPYRASLLSLCSLAGLILLIALANVATLTLIELSQNLKDLATRYALGASLGRLVRSVIASTITRAGIGAVAGLGLAYILLIIVRSIGAGLIPRLNQVGLDWRVASFSIALALLTGLLAAAAPVHFLLRSDLSSTLTGSIRHVRRSMLLLTRHVLLGAQIAVALILMTSAIVSLRTLYNLTHVQLGFDEQRTLSAQVSLSERTYSTVQQLGHFQQEWLAAVQSDPEIGAAGFVDSLPLSGDSAARLSVKKENKPTMAGYSLIGGQYFRAIGIPILEGRTFLERDGVVAPPVIVLSRALAKTLWGNKTPVGEQLLIEGEPVRREIIGVVGDVRSTLDEEPEPQMYLPFTQPFRKTLPNRLDMTLIVKTRIPDATITTILRNQLSQIDKNVPLFHVKKLADVVFWNSVPSRLRMAILTVVGSLALGLALLGIYATITYSFLIRQRELGLKLALGAQIYDIQWDIVRQTVLVAGSGIAFGLLASVWVVAAFRALWYNVSSNDWSIYGIASALFLIGAVGAAIVPVLRARRIEPAQMLRID
ncbi:MAG: FtsX-like permease family protein [Bryobacteraceae bacterium]